MLFLANMNANLAKVLYYHIGLQQLYMNNQNISEHVRMLPSLAFVPSSEVKECFDILVEDMPEELDELVSYFEVTYIARRGGRPPRFPIPDWNQYDRIKKSLPRTNNGVEAWHSSINTVLGCSNPTIWKLLNFLQKEAQYQEVRVNALERGETIPKRRKYQEHDQRIIRLVEQYGTKDTISYLKSISYLLSY